jgi:hypothetical protein
MAHAAKAPMNGAIPFAAAVSEQEIRAEVAASAL